MKSSRFQATKINVPWRPRQRPTVFTNFGHQPYVPQKGPKHEILFEGSASAASPPSAFLRSFGFQKVAILDASGETVGGFGGPLGEAPGGSGSQMRPWEGKGTLGLKTIKKL